MRRWRKDACKELTVIIEIDSYLMASVPASPLIETPRIIGVLMPVATGPER